MLLMPAHIPFHATLFTIIWPVDFYSCIHLKYSFLLSTFTNDFDLHLIFLSFEYLSLLEIFEVQINAKYQKSWLTLY